MNALLRELVASLRVEAQEQQESARRLNAQGVPVYNPIQWGRMQAKRDAADRIEALLRNEAADT